MNILCPDLELIKILTEANKDNKEVSVNYIHAPDYKNYNHVDYIMECASVMQKYDYGKFVFCFRFYAVASSEWKYQDVLASNYTDFDEVLLYVMYSDEDIVVGKNALPCQVIDNKKQYEVWDFDLMCHVSDPLDSEIIGSYAYNKFVFHEPLYIIPIQLVPNMA